MIRSLPTTLSSTAASSTTSLTLLGRPPVPKERFIDTLVLAREHRPGSPASLDAVCKRFNISIQDRVLHGALLDAQLLARAYLELRGGRERAFDFANAGGASAQAQAMLTPCPQRPTPLGPLITADEVAAHAAFVGGLGENAIWKKYGLGRGRLLGLRFGALALLAVEADEIDRIDHQRRVAAFSCDVRNDPAREREEQARALDQQQRLHVFAAGVLQLDDAGVDQLADEHDSSPAAWRGPTGAARRRKYASCGGPGSTLTSMPSSISGAVLACWAAEQARILE